MSFFVFTSTRKDKRASSFERLYWFNSFLFFSLKSTQYSFDIFTAQILVMDRASLGV